MGIFSDLASTTIGEVKAPPLLPIGHYQAQFVGQFKEHQAKSGNTAARFPMKLLAPGDNVDLEELAAAGGIPENKTYTYDFWMSPDALYRFTDFAKAQGVSESSGLMDALEAVGTEGTPFLIEVKHEPDSRDASKIYLRFDNPAPLA